MTRAKGIRNKPKEMLDPQLSKLTAIVADLSQDAETRHAAAKALQDALTPEPPEPAPQQPTAPWPGYMECPCGNLFDNADVCANCRAYLDRCKAREAAQRKDAPPQPAFDEAAFQRELDELERGLGLSEDA